MAEEHPYTVNEVAIEAILRYVCRSKHLRPEDAEEFSQWTRVKLIERDCAILRSYQRTCPFKNFLITVILNKYRDWLDETKGKFRVTEEAKRLGPISVQLETMVLRDQIPYDEAVQILISKGKAASTKQCDEIWGQLKRAVRRHFVSDEELEFRYQGPSLDPMELDERRRLTRKVYAALQASLAALAPSDNLIFRWRYWDQLTVAAIAKLQQAEQKPLYRRFEQLLKQLEADLLARGVTEEEMRRLFEDLGIDPDEFHDEGGK